MYSVCGGRHLSQALTTFRTEFRRYTWLPMVFKRFLWHATVQLHRCRPPLTQQTRSQRGAERLYPHRYSEPVIGDQYLLIKCSKSDRPRPTWSLSRDSVSSHGWNPAYTAVPLTQRAPVRNLIIFVITYYRQKWPFSATDHSSMPMPYDERRYQIMLTNAIGSHKIRLDNCRACSLLSNDSDLIL